MNRKIFGWQQTVEFLGVVGVIASLIFVAFEIRQNTDAVRSSTIQAIAQLSYDATMASVDNADLRAARLAAQTGDLTQDQIIQLDAWFSALMRIHQNRLLQAELGILDLEAAIQIGGRAYVYRQPYFADYWARRKGTYPPEFQRYIEQYILVLADE